GPFSFGNPGDIALTGRFPSTGRSAIGVFRSPPGERGDFFLDSNSNHILGVGEGPFNLVNVAPAEFNPSSLVVKIPLTMLSADDGFVNFGVIIGTAAEFTDEAPDSGPRDPSC